MLNVDTDASPWDAGTVGSRSMLVAGNAVKLAAEDARNQILRMAAGQLEASPEDLEIVDKQIQVKGAPSRSVSLASVCNAGHNEIGDVIGRGYFDSKASQVDERERGSSQPFCTHAAMVEVDTDTGNVKMLKYVAVHDVGFVVHPKAVDGQIEGAAAMSLGQALCEQVVHDEQGRTLNPTFVDYLMPTINMLPRIEAVTVSGYPGAGPLRHQGSGRDRLRAAHGLHRQRHLQRHRRACPQAPAEPRERAAGAPGSREIGSRRGTTGRTWESVP